MKDSQACPMWTSLKSDFCPVTFPELERYAMTTPETGALRHLVGIPHV